MLPHHHPQAVSERMAPEQLSNPFKHVEIQPGWWRGAIDMVTGIRMCKVRLIGSGLSI